VTVRSAVYEGEVRHRRFAPVSNEFRYRMFLLYIDLAELPGLLDPYLLWSARGPISPGSAGRLPGRPFGAARPGRAGSRGGAAGFRPPGAVRLLTHLRYFGCVFNP